MRVPFTQLACFEHVEWRPDAARLRQFAVAMAVGFGLLGLLAVWRGHGVGTAAEILWAVGAALAAGALVPHLGRWVYLAVIVPTSIVGYAVSQVVLTLVFWLLIVPLGAGLRASGKDLLRLRRPKGDSMWMTRRPPAEADRYYRQF